MNTHFSLEEILISLKKRLQKIRENRDFDTNIPINSSRVLVKEGVY